MAVVDDVLFAVGELFLSDIASHREVKRKAGKGTTGRVEGGKPKGNLPSSV